MTARETGLAVVDGREALAVVIFRPGRGDAPPGAEVHAQGTSRLQLAVWLRELADGLERAAAEPT